MKKDDLKELKSALSSKLAPLVLSSSDDSDAETKIEILMSVIDDINDVYKPKIFRKAVILVDKIDGETAKLDAYMRIMRKLNGELETD